MPCRGGSGSPSSRNGEWGNGAKQPWRNGRSGSPARKSKEYKANIQAVIAKAVAKEFAKVSPEPRPRVAQDWQAPMKGWMCPACDYHNWAKRTECRECNWHKEAGEAQLPRSPATESTKSDSSSEVEIVKVMTIREPTEQ